MAKKKKGIKRDTLSDKRKGGTTRLERRLSRMEQAAVTANAPLTAGQKSLNKYMGEEKYLIRKPKRRRGQGRHD